MSKTYKLIKNNRGQDLWGKFSELEKLLNVDKKEDSEDQLIEKLIHIKNLANECNLGAKELNQNLLKALQIAKDYSDRDDFFKFCLQLPGEDELRKSSSLPTTTRDFAKDFSLSFYTLDVSRWSGNSSAHRSQYLRLTDGILDGKSFKKYLWNKILNIFVQSESMAKNRVMREDSSITTIQEISLSDLDPLRYELGNRYIIDCFKNYLRDAKRWEKYYFEDTFIAAPISMNESDSASENYEFILYQSERNIFKAAHGSSNPWKCEKVKITDILKHNSSIAEKYQYLLLAPPNDCYGNETYIWFNAHGNPYLRSDKKNAGEGRSYWEAFYENDQWIQRSRVKENQVLLEQRKRFKLKQPPL